MELDSERIARNLQTVRERMAAACERAGRDADAVQLVAVTKTVGVEEIRALRACGVRDFGENRIPAGPEKVQALDDPELRWHFIGHLQRNKAGKALPYFRIYHGLESLDLARRMQQLAEEHAIESVDVTVEVNISGEASKYGVSPGEAEAFLKELCAFSRLNVMGLMTMAPWGDEPEAARPVFRGLRELRDVLRKETGMLLPELSMGMSGDFEVAIEEGATLVRVGSALFV